MHTAAIAIVGVLLPILLTLMNDCHPLPVPMVLCHATACIGLCLFNLAYILERILERLEKLGQCPQT